MKKAKHANYFREARKNQKISQERLAVAAGLTRPTLSRIEHADREELGIVKLGTLLAVAEALNVPLADLLPGLRL